MTIQRTPRKSPQANGRWRGWRTSQPPAAVTRRRKDGTSAQTSDPMTARQRPFYADLCAQTGSEFDPTLSKAQARAEIDRLISLRNSLRASGRDAEAPQSGLGPGKAG